ncbi:MAG: ribosome maturation factor RimP [Nitrospinaceae bacterium]
MGSIVQTVEHLVQPVLADMGLELVNVEYKKEGQHWVLRIYIDTEEGVTVDHCSAVSRQVGDLIDVEGLIPVHYYLEVSSPGLDRPLKREQDFVRFKSRRISVKTFAPIGDRRNFKGTILDCKEGLLYLDAQGTAYEVPLDNIAKANLEIEI